MHKPLRILTSVAAWEGLAPKIAELMGQRPYVHLSPEAVLSRGQTADVAFISREVTGMSTKFDILPETQQFYDALLQSNDLKWVHVHSAGADRPVYQALMKRGVVLTTSSGANARAVAHSALAGILSLARAFPKLMQQQRHHQWRAVVNENSLPDLNGQTALIIGWGPIGQLIGKVLDILELDLIVARRNTAALPEGYPVVSTRDLPQVLGQVDWLILACPLTPETRHLVDARVLAALKPGARVVNIARGEVIDEPALIHALASGQLGGAYLDVYAQEPLPADSPLWDMPNVIATPHSAGHSRGMYQRMAQMFLDNLARYLGDQPLAQVATPAEP